MLGTGAGSGGRGPEDCRGAERTVGKYPAALGPRCARCTRRPIRRRRRLSKKGFPEAAAAAIPEAARAKPLDVCFRAGPASASRAPSTGSGRSVAQDRGRRGTRATSGPTSSAGSARSVVYAERGVPGGRGPRHPLRRYGAMNGHLAEIACTVAPGAQTGSSSVSSTTARPSSPPAAQPEPLRPSARHRLFHRVAAIRERSMHRAIGISSGGTVRCAENRRAPLWRR